MSINSFGHLLKLTTWGESHGPAIGAVLDGCPPNIEITIAEIQKYLDERKPGTSKYVTQRQEDDKIEILSGVLPKEDDKKSLITTGTAISLIIYNKDQRSKDYNDVKDRFRPGHADFTYQEKYKIRDHRGGGRSSARETTMRVAAGAIARKIIPEVKIRAALIQMGERHINRNNWNWEETRNNPFFCPDKEAVTEFENYLDNIRKQGSSCGAMIEVVAENVPVGLGAPIYAKLDQDITSALMSINAVKSVEIGEGVNAASLRGEENADEIRSNDGKPHFLSNKAGGILGGISSGQPIIARMAVKPTSSILIDRKSIDKYGNEIDIKTKGRHDPCVGIRAVPIAEAMIALVLADHYLLNRGQIG